MRRIVAMAVVVSLAGSVLVEAVGGKNAAYVGGTVVGLKEKTEGTLSTQSETEAVFQAKEGRALFPYSAITGLEYGQKAGRRVAVAVLISPLALFSKKRNHYLTITYNDAAGKEQAAVFELGKDVIRTTLKILEVRSGKSVEFQDDEARKSGVGGGE